MLGLSDIASRIAQSTIRTMSVECDKVGGINLAQGVCDTEVPSVVRAGAEAAIEAGFNQYTRLDGIARLRHAIARKLERQNGIIADPESEILATSGATGGFDAACRALLNPGDEVILFEPYYGYHYATLVGQHCRPVLVALDPPEYKLQPERLVAAITPRTRGIMVNTPANPSGKIFSREDLENLLEIATTNDLFVFTDEIYEHFVYDGRRHISPASLPGAAERTITISGFSKTFSITGWRVGFLYASARWIPAISYFHDLSYVCAPSAFQHGVAAGLEELPETFYSELVRDYQHKREMICEALRSAGLEPHVPAGSYYVLADASSVPGSNSAEKAMTLLRIAGVASVPGSAFFQGGRGEHLLRFCFAKTDRDLEQACERLSRIRQHSQATAIAR
ncbi:MAG TPA: pyridoxal phosphate-dependent aminotransferase [Terriglobales bacterium]|jgi:aminotransferase|nr:pyridoxal phosphate-dependent aminotransferase [Terriglobales bacterium]